MTTARRAEIETLGFIDQDEVDSTAGTETIRQGMPVKWGTAGLVEATGATDEILGVAYTNEDGAWPATSGERVNYVRLGSPCVVPCRVGAAGTTIRAIVVPDTNGVVDTATRTAPGTTLANAVGRAVATAVTGDLVGVYLGENRAFHTGT